jgi:hypothetical protein
MSQPRRPAGIPTGGQFAPTNRPEASGIELVDDDPRVLPAGYEDLVADDGDRVNGRIMAFAEDPDGDGRDRWTVRFANGEERTDFADEFELATDEDGEPISRPRSDDEIVAARRAHTLRSLALDEVFDGACSVEDVVDDARRYLFVERNVFSDGAFWATFDTPAATSAYHLDQECPEYWDAAYLLDLDTGERFQPVAGMRWQPDPLHDKEEQP